MDIILYNGNMLLHTQSYEELDGHNTVQWEYMLLRTQSYEEHDGHNTVQWEYALTHTVI